MGFDPISLSLEAASAFLGSGAAAGATAAGTAAAGAAAGAGAGALTGTVATGLGAAATAGTAAGATIAGTAATGAAAGLSASTLATIGAAAGSTLLASALAPKPPKPGEPPKSPTLFGNGPGATAMLGPSVGDANGTFLSGNNRAPQISGGKKTLLGQ